MQSTMAGVWEKLIDLEKDEIGGSVCERLATQVLKCNKCYEVLSRKSKEELIDMLIHLSNPTVERGKPVPIRRYSKDVEDLDNGKEVTSE